MTMFALVLAGGKKERLLQHPGLKAGASELYGLVCGPDPMG